MTSLHCTKEDNYRNLRKRDSEVHRPAGVMHGKIYFYFFTFVHARQARHFGRAILDAPDSFYTLLWGACIPPSLKASLRIPWTPM